MSNQEIQDHRHNYNLRRDAAVVPSLELSSAEEAVLSAPFKHSLFAKVLGKRVGFQRLSAHLLSLWRPAGVIQIVPLARDFYLVNFSLPSDYDDVLAGFPWTIDDHYIVLLKWVPDFKPSEAVIGLVAVWVRLPELLVQYYDEEILLKIGELIGEEVVKIDSCTKNRTKCKYARLCILIDLSKPVVPMIEIAGALQRIQYEGLHLVCYSCGRYGHRQELCRHTPSSPAAAIPELCFSGETSTESSVQSSPLYGPWLQVRRGYQHPSGTRTYPGEDQEKKPVSMMYRPIKTAFVPRNNPSEQRPLDLQHGEGTSKVAETVTGSSMETQNPEASSSSGHADTASSTPPSPSPVISDDDHPNVPETCQTPPSTPSNATANPNAPVSSQQKEDSPPLQNDSPTESLPLQGAGAGITNQQRPPPEVIEFYSQVIQRLTTHLEINSSDVSITELVLEGKPQLVTFDSKISNIEIGVNMSALFTWNSNQHNISLNTTVIDHTEFPIEKSSKKVLIWNPRGAGNAKFLPTIKALCQQHHPSAVLVLETRISGPDSDRVIGDIGFSESFIVEPVGFTGGMWLLWCSDDLEVEVYSATPQQIHLAIEFLPKPETLILCGGNSGIGHEYSGVFGIDSSDSDHGSQARSSEVYNLDQQIVPQTSQWISSY